MKSTALVRSSNQKNNFLVKENYPSKPSVCFATGKCTYQVHTCPYTLCKGHAVVLSQSLNDRKPRPLRGPLTNDCGIMSCKLYTVQTASRILACMIMIFCVPGMLLRDDTGICCTGRMGLRTSGHPGGGEAAAGHQSTHPACRGGGSDKNGWHCGTQ